jgi:DNA-directed RNA polymerase specialized sigma subunit
VSIEILPIPFIVWYYVFMTDELISQFQKEPSNKEFQAAVLHAHKDYIQANINKWKGVLPDPVIDAYGKKYALQAFETYDPSKSSINTHLYNNLSQLSRMVYKAQNAVRIPESQVQMIGRVNQARSYLADELGREPNTDEIADHLHLPKQHIAKVIKNQRADFINDSDTEMQSAYGEHDTATSDRLFSYRQSLEEPMKRKFDALTGFGDTKPLSPQEFGLKFKLKPYEVSRLKSRFAKELK